MFYAKKMSCLGTYRNQHGSSTVGKVEKVQICHQVGYMTVSPSFLQVLIYLGRYRCRPRVHLGHQEEYMSVSSSCFLFTVKRHVPAGSSTVGNVARVQLKQQEDNMTVSLYLSSNFGFCKKVQAYGVTSTSVMGARVRLR
jgi:hypothetical protein